MRVLGGDRRGVSAVVGTLLMLAVVVLLAGTVFILAITMTKGSDNAPEVYSFIPDYSAATIKVNAAPTGADWNRLRVEGCTGVPSGPIQAGQWITDCSGHVLIADQQTNTTLVTFEFPT